MISIGLVVFGVLGVGVFMFFFFGRIKESMYYSLTYVIILEM